MYPPLAKAKWLLAGTSEHKKQKISDSISLICSDSFHLRVDYSCFKEE
jgi:hypothetical protein